MNKSRFQYIYGPVPSRRLGRSLGIDLVPFKTCTYDCIYCQLGATTNKTLERKEYVAVADILGELEQELTGSDTFDYISLAGSGEPTLNSGIGDLIPKIKSLTNIPVAVITNSSLLWMDEVQDALMPADLVLPSLDVGDKTLFECVNRPHKEISFEQMIDGLADFTYRYQGEVWLETLLLAGVTGIKGDVEKIASMIRRLKVARIQLNTVIRPPAMTFATPLSQNQMLAFKEAFPGKVDIISDFELGDWSEPLNLQSNRNDILSMLSRRPCTVVDIASSLGVHPSEALKQLDALMIEGKAETVRMSEKIFYATKGLNDELRP